MYEVAFGWILTYFAHSTALLLLAWMASRSLGSRRLAAKEFVWRLALMGGLLTATLQYSMAWEPVGGKLRLRSLSPRAVEQELAPVEGYSGTGRSEAESLVSRAIPIYSTVEAETSRRGVSVLVVSAWLTLSLILIGRLAVAFLRLRYRLRDRTRVTEGRLFNVFLVLAAAAGLEGRVLLSSSAQIRVPLARGLRRGEVCVPTKVREKLDEDQQEIVLAHELAHLSRHDPAWLLLARILECVLFFQPLNVLARRQLQEIAELRCDDWAVERTGRPVALARCLTQVAEWGLEKPYPLAALSMAGSGSQLGQRVRRLLDRGYPRPDGGVPIWLRVGVPLVLAVVTLAAPGASGVGPVAPPVPEQPAVRVETPREATPALAPQPAIVAVPSLPAPGTPASAAEVPAAPAVAPAPVGVALAKPAPVVAGAAISEPAVPAPRIDIVPEIHLLELEELEQHLQRLEVVLESEARAMAEAATSAAIGSLAIGSIDEELERIAVEPEGGEGELESSERSSAKRRQADSELARERLEAEIERVRARHEEGLEALEERLERHTEALLDPERMRQIEDAIAERTQRMTERAEQMAAEMERFEKELQSRSLSDEARLRLAEEARRRAEEMRPTREEMLQLREEIRAELERAWPQLKEQRRLQAEFRREIEQWRAQLREDLELTTEALRELREDLD
jgi:beta-lactamase regulating signal transducer with metallopeptidase domain